MSLEEKQDVNINASTAKITGCLYIFVFITVGFKRVKLRLFNTMTPF